MKTRNARLWLLCVAAAAAAGGGLCLARTQPPAAVLTDVAGQVSVLRAGTSTVVSTACPLRTGDCVTTGAPGSARILFPDRPPVVLGPGSRHAVGQAGQPAATEAQAGVLGRIWQAITGRLRSAFVGEREARPGAARGDDPALPHPAYPRNTVIIEIDPEFAWTPVEGADGYEVTIGFYDTYERISRIVSQPTRAQYPEDAEALAPGRKYFWCVQEAGGRYGMSEVVWFAVLDGPQWQEYRAADEALGELYETDTPAWHQAAGHLAADFGLHALAIEHLQTALAADDTPAVRRALADALGAVDLPTQAKALAADLPELTGEERRLWQEVEPTPLDEEPDEPQ